MIIFLRKWQTCDKRKWQLFEFLGKNNCLSKLPTVHFFLPSPVKFENLECPAKSTKRSLGGDNAQFENGWATVMIVKLSRHIINNFKSYNFVCNIDCPQSNALDKYYTRFFKSDVNFVCKNGRKSEVNLPWSHKLRETLLRTYCMNLLKNISLCSNYSNF